MRGHQLQWDKTVINDHITEFVEIQISKAKTNFSCPRQERINRVADKSLARPGRKQATATDDFDVHIPIYYHNWRNISTIYIYIYIYI
jgi:hypothetical protein